MISPETLELVRKWKTDPRLNDFMRQVHVDIYVGLKNGLPVRIAKKALHELCKDLEESVEWIPIEVKRQKRKVEVLPDPYTLMRALGRMR